MTVKNILIIDDNEGDQLLTQMIIESYDPDINVLHAYDGQEGLDVLATASTSPELVLLDINMPGMNGHEFLEAYSKQEKHVCVVVMLTTSIQNKDKDRCMGYSFVKQYIEKPLDFQKLEKVSSLA